MTVFNWSYVYLFLVLQIIIVLFVDSASDTENELRNKRLNHQSLELEDYKISKISNLSDMKDLTKHIENIMIPRVVGTDGHEKVLKYISNEMENLGWFIEYDKFTDKTPIFGDLEFTNIIATVNPKAERFLILACHYDSKYFKDQEFLAATDSAVPCAMMINLASVLKNYLTPMKDCTELGLKFIFFDGEEAFDTWTATDSIYGARHLAAKWEKENFLNHIDMIILLDLLGSPDPVFYSFFQNTERWYAKLISAEERLDNLTLLEKYQNSGVINRSSKRYFQSRSVNAFIEDDHIPFLRRDVPIVHMIPVPFPDVWHKITDDMSAIDKTTVENLNKILRIFVIEYLRLSVE